MGDRGTRRRWWLGDNLMGVAGWLFVDLLMGLLVIFIASTSTFVAAKPAVPTPLPSVTPSPTPSPICTKSVSHDELHAGSPPGPGGTTPTRDQLVNAFANYRGKAAGIVLTTVTDTDIGTAQNDAARVNAVLAEAVPDVVTTDTILKPLGFLDRNIGNRGTTQFDFYLFVTTCVPVTAAPQPPSG